MTTMTRLPATILLLLALLIASAGARALTAEVDRQRIGPQETVTLTLRQQGRNVSETPDFSALRNHFDVLNNQRSHQMRIVNGEMTSTTEWNLTLSPKRSGKLIIPAFELGDATSEPIEITVSEQSQSPEGGNRDIFIETELDKEQLHVQEQLRLTVRLYSRVNLEGAEIQPLELDNVVVKALDENNYITRIDGRQHIVLETTLALFPQRSGTLEIPPLVYDLAVSSGQRGFWGGSQRRRARSEPLSIEVDPKPEQYDGRTWLPAGKIELRESWSRDPEQLRQGEPVTRRLIIEAEGLTAAQLPELTAESHPEVTRYPDQPRTEEQVDAEGVRSTSTLTVALVPNRSGELTLPPVELTWWDSEADRMRTAELPKRTLEVAPGPDAQTPPPEEPKEPDSSAIEKTPEPESGAAQPASPRLLWLLAVIATILLGLALWFAYTAHRLKKQLAEREVRAQRSREQARIARARSWHAVKTAAHQDDLHALRRALLDWGAALWPQLPPKGLTDLAQRVDDEVARAHLQELDALLFRGDGSEHQYDAETLIRALNHSRVGHRSSSNGGDDLRPLYRSGS